jgi:hypothetical protein
VSQAVERLPSKREALNSNPEEQKKKKVFFFFQRSYKVDRLELNAEIYRGTITGRFPAFGEQIGGISFNLDAQCYMLGNAMRMAGDTRLKVRDPAP